MQYLFTAIFTKNEKGLLDVNFPDLPNCRTQGNNMVDAAKKAEAVLSLCLFDMEQHGISIPASRPALCFTREYSFVVSPHPYDFHSAYIGYSVFVFQTFVVGQHFVHNAMLPVYTTRIQTF